jgi:hypothetical protein
MSRYRLVIQLDPADGKEAEFLDHYPNVHMADVINVPGFISGQMFRKCATFNDAGPHRWEYFVEYELETDDPEKFLATLRGKVASGEVRGNVDVMGPKRRSCMYEPITQLFTPSASGNQN